MAIAEYKTGTETVTSSSEWSLTTDTSSGSIDTTKGVYQTFLDLRNLTASTSGGTDVFEFRVYEKVLTGSTQGLVYSARFAGPQGAPNWSSPSLVLMNGWDMTLKKITGTNESIDWSIRYVTTS
jgi:hypothetical protein